jgi:uncharacterized membrane protein
MKTLYPLVGILIIFALSFSSSCKHEPWLPEGFDPTDTTGTGSDTTGTGTGTGIDTTGTGSNPDYCDPDSVYFENDILPILSSSCAIPGCHDPGTAQDGIVFTSYANAMASGEIKPGNPNDSDVYENLVENDPDKKMPPPNSGVTLTSHQINLIYKWIAQGAKNNSCDPNAGQCDTLNMSFSQDIQPIINNNCKGCHSGASPQGGINLTNYNAIQSVATSSQLVGVITHAPGYKPMPHNQDKMDDCTIAKIRNWVNEGAKNN